MEGSLKTEKEFLGNGGKEEVLAGYNCEFQTMTQEGGYRNIFITLFLVEEKTFARIIQDPRWNIIPIARIADSTDPEELLIGYGVFASHEKSPPLTPKKPPANLKRGRSVEQYCNSFAKAYSQKSSASLNKSSLSLSRENLLDKVEKWVSNFFQPRGSKFIAGYKCQFEISSLEGKKTEEVFIYIFLTETYSFAEYTTSPEWQIIPIEYVQDPLSKKEGYAIFKFLKENGDLIFESINGK